jgi:hypothetical protein
MKVLFLLALRPSLLDEMYDLYEENECAYVWFHQLQRRYDTIDRTEEFLMECACLRSRALLNCAVYCRLKS